QGGPPPLLRRPEFDADRARLRALAAGIRGQVEAEGKPQPATLEEARKVIAAARTKLESTVKKDTPGYPEAERHLKALTGLTRMLETPAIDVLLAGVEKRPDATLGELLTFMNAFNLQFGPANTPHQRQIFETLYPMLVKVRDEVAP